MKPATRTTVIVAFFATLLFAVSVGAEGAKTAISGKTMGTTYHLTVAGGAEIDQKSLKAAVDRELARINKSMSTYDPESEISRFNRFSKTGEPFPVSNDFYTVMETAAWLHRESRGAWDGTVGPLVDRWGFGRKKRTAELPTHREVDLLLQTVGFENIQFVPPLALAKVSGGVALDLASIAKGYGVDRVAALLEERGHTDFLVEIGGEVYASGSRPDGTPWRVGINYPERGGAVNKIYRVMRLQDRAMATSGDYRNYFVMDGKAYSHIVDPRTGYPVSNRVASASVVASSCTLADGMATAMMVMGPDESIALADRTSGLECILLVRETDGRFTEHLSKGFRPSP